MCRKTRLFLNDKQVNQVARVRANRIFSKIRLTFLEFPKSP